MSIQLLAPKMADVDSQQGQKTCCEVDSQDILVVIPLENAVTATTEQITKSRQQKAAKERLLNTLLATSGVTHYVLP